MDNLDFLDAPSGEPAPTPVIEPEAIEPEAPDGRSRGPDGRFASPQPPEMAPDPEPAPEPPQEDPRFAEFQSQIAGLTKALQSERQKGRQQPPQPAPDRYEDPEGYEAHRDQAIESRLLNHTLNTSERFARKDHGSQVVDQARDWALEKFQNDPLYYQRVMSDADPYEAVVQDWKREQVLSSMKDGDLDAFLAWKSGAHAAPAPTVAPPPQSLIPPRSMAAAPNAGGANPGAQPVGPNVAFDTVFKE